MRLKKVRILGFQSYADSGDVALEDGINLLVGQNNAGKSSFLRTLQFEFKDDRHRTPECFSDFNLPPPEVSLSFELEGSELLEGVLRSNKTTVPVNAITPENALVQLKAFFACPTQIIEIVRHPAETFARFPIQRQLGRDQVTLAVVVPKDGNFTVSEIQNRPGQHMPPHLFQQIWGQNMFFFAAERYPTGSALQVHVERLEPSAENLPAVLQTLWGNRGTLFLLLVEHLCEIFPTVGNLSVRTLPSNDRMVEIRVWPSKLMKQVELSFPLNASGTGVAQVIAILTAIMTIEKAVIIIDEINSFLHPAAVKALLRIIQTHYAQHQYIISTHSPEVIAFSNCRSIHMVRRDGYESTIQSIDLRDVAAVREIAGHLGVAMADVFAADQIIWVEGQTEELCFPYLYNAAVGPLPRNLAMISVVATGDFNAKRRDRELVYAIYQRLSTATAMLARSVAFSFDKEDLKDREMAEMINASQGLLHFLPRRHLESYLLDTDAIAAFVNDGMKEAGFQITSDKVKVAIEETAKKSAFKIDAWNGDISNPDWQSRVDAAKLINSVCERLTESQLTFNKKHDSLFLLKHIYENKPSALEELLSYVKKLVHPDYAVA